MSEERSRHRYDTNKRTASTKRRKKKKNNTGLTVLCIVMFIVLGLLVLGTAYIENLMNRIDRVDPSISTTLSQEEIDDILNQTDAIDPTDTTPTMKPEEITWDTTPATPIGGEHVINILLIGQDAREGQGTQRSDSMILCTLNKETKKLTMTSFMRDMYVPIPGHGSSRINAAYAIGGMKLLDQTILQNFGVEIDGNVEVDFYGFMEMIDLLGGIEMELTQAEADYLNRRGNWGVEDNAGEWTLTEGVNNLTGSQALAYCRVRDIGDDFGRTERQRKVLTELLDMVKDLNMLQLNNLLYTALDMITTDMTNSQITSLVLEVFPMLGDLEIVTQRIPVWGAYENANINGAMVLVPDLEKNKKLLADAMED